MEKAWVGKDMEIAPNKGRMVASEELPKQEVLDELDELYHYASHYSKPVSNQIPNVPETTKEMSCLFSCCRDTFNEDEIIESFLNMPPLQEMQNPISITNIQQHQFVDLPLNQIRHQQPLKYLIKIIQDRPLICYQKYIDYNEPCIN